MIELIPLEKLSAAPDNPRSAISDVEDLAASIRNHGVLEPLLVTPDGKGAFTVVVGHRRFAGAQAAGLDSVPAIVREFESDADRREVMLVENLQREDLSPLEEARAYQQLLEMGRSQKDVADSVGRSQSHISKRLSLLELPAEVIADVDAGEINVGIALELIKLKDHPEELSEIIENIKSDPEWMNVENVAQEVEGSLKHIERRQRTAEISAELEAKGVRVVKNGRPLGKNEWNGLGLNTKAHAKEPCHGATIGTWDQKVTYVCTDAKRHAPNGDSKLKSPVLEQSSIGTPQERETNEREEKLKEVALGRQDFVRGLLARKKLTVGDVLEFVLADYVDEGLGHGRRALSYLGAEETFDYLHDFAAQGSQQLLKASLAKTIAGAEDEIQQLAQYGCDFYGDERSSVPRYFEFLQARGYELTQPEADLLEEIERDLDLAKVAEEDGTK